MLLPAVQRSQHQDQPSPLLSGERRNRRRRRCSQTQPEMQCGFDALRHVCVKGNNRCKRCSRRGICKHPKLAVAAILAKQHMAAVRPAGDKCCRRQLVKCQRAGGFERRRDQDDRRRQDVWIPERGRLIATLPGITWKSSGPSALPAPEPPPGRSPLGFAKADSSVDSLGDIAGRVSETPRQILSAVRRPNSRSILPTATLLRLACDNPHDTHIRMPPILGRTIWNSPKA
jgi:hypothetical protein